MMTDAERAAACTERARNVIVEAGAGTGKSTLLVDRLLHLLAPVDDGVAYPLSRLAVVTGTRAAAAELRLRIRERLLAEAARSGASALCAERLERALAEFDQALIASPHGFAARLLGLCPADAQQSPAYEPIEDPSALVDETSRRLLAAAEQGTLAAALRGSEAAALASEAGETLRMWLAAWPLDEREPAHGAPLAFGTFVADVIATRAADVALPPRRAPDLMQVRRHADELARSARDLGGDSAGARCLLRLTRQALQISATKDPGEALRRAHVWRRDFERACHAGLGMQFGDDRAGRGAWQWLAEGVRGRGRQREQRAGGPLAVELLLPLSSWLAERMVRLRPVILCCYAQLKRERKLLDAVDLLRGLRDRLQRDLVTRAALQARFDHLLLDELDRADPLAAEIVLYLGEHGARARRCEDVALAPGKLTLVGDPRQQQLEGGLGPYAQLCQRLRAGPACEARLGAALRATRHLQRLPCGRAEPGAEGARAGDALAHYLRFLVEDSPRRITDLRSGEARRARYGDIAVLTVAPHTERLLTAALDRLGVPYAVSGGALLLEDALHRQFVSSLRALADRGDGVARAALFRPPFFAIGLDQLVRDRIAGEKSAALREAEAVLAELRQLRHQLTPGETARRVIEQTCLGRAVAAGPNGAQRLARLYDLCAALDEHARHGGLDFDGATELARGWLDAPLRREQALPVDADAVQILPVQQASGLSWPIVALWDGGAPVPEPAFAVAANGDWALALAGLRYDASGGALPARQAASYAAEQERLAYLAETRAGDLLIVPETGAAETSPIVRRLLASGRGERVGAYGGAGPRWWQSASGVSMRPLPPLRPELDVAWARAAERARQPLLAPRSAAGAPFHAGRAGRFDPPFGDTVQRALQLLLSGRAGNPDGATRQAARERGLEERVPEALADVNRALDALQRSGWLAAPSYFDYPLAGSPEPSSLCAGSIDLVIAAEEALVVLDVSTDVPPEGAFAAAWPEHSERLRTYARWVERAGLAAGRPIRAGVLFTADGELRWA